MKSTQYILIICEIVKKKKSTNELIYKTEIVTDVKNKFMITRGWGERDKLGDWDWYIHTINTMYNIDNWWEPTV